MELQKERVVYFLEDIAENIENFIEFVSSPNEHLGPFQYGIPYWARYEGGRNYYERYRRRKVRDYLLRKKYIEAKRQGEESYILFTNKGLVRLLREKIKTVPETLTDQECLIMFDIPEAARGVRDELRNFLKSVGFKMEQKSVWTTRKDAQPYLEALCTASGIGRWVKVARKPIRTNNSG